MANKCPKHTGEDEVSCPRRPRTALGCYLTNHIIQRHTGRRAEAISVFCEPKRALTKTLEEAWQQGEVTYSSGGKVNICHSFDRKIGTYKGTTTSTIFMVVKYSCGVWVMVTAYPIPKEDKTRKKAVARRTDHPSDRSKT